MLALATSVDGRRFTFQAPLEPLELRAGGYVELQTPAGRWLGQLLSLEIARGDAGEVGWTGETTLSSRVTFRLATGEGAVLSGPPVPFHDAVIRPAAPAAVQAWLHETMPARAVLPAGELRLAPGVTLGLDAGGFNRHTFLCGQSGSGKTYALGVLIERLLLETGLRDGHPRPQLRLRAPRATSATASTPSSPRATGRRPTACVVHRGEATGHDRLRVRLRRTRPRADRRRRCGWTRSPTARSTRSSSRCSTTTAPAASFDGPRPRRWRSARATSASTAGASGPARTRGPRSMRSTIPPCAAWSSTSARSPPRRSRHSSPKPCSTGSGAGATAASRC